MKKGLTDTLKRTIAGRTYSVEIAVEYNAELDDILVTGIELKRGEVAIAAGVAIDGPPSGEAFSWMRRVLGLSAEKLGALLDVQPRTISRWETGATNVDRAAWIALGDLVLEEAGKPSDARGRLQRIVDGVKAPKERRV